MDAMNSTETADCRPERRASGADLHNIVRLTYGLTTRVAVLETRLDAQDARLTGIDGHLREVKDGVARVMERLIAHAESENTDRVRLLFWVITTLVSVLGFGATALLNWLFR